MKWFERIFYCERKSSILFNLQNSKKIRGVVRIFEHLKKTISILFFCFIVCKITIGQSLRTITLIGDKAYIVHAVAVRQNLYRISKYYQTSVQELKKMNNLEGDSISKGVELFIPLNRKNFVLQTSKTKKEISYQNLYIEPTHQLSKKYLKTVLPIDAKLWDEFLKKNEVDFKSKRHLLVGYLATFNIDLVPPSAPKTVIKKDTIKKEVLLLVKKDTLKPNTIADSLAKPKIASAQQKIFEKLYAKTEAAETFEKGTALGMIPDSVGNYQKGFYAFHNDLKVGTIVKLKNPMNDNEVYVKILGKIPELVGNTRCSIKISHDAAIYLDAIDERFLVEIYHH